MRLIADENISWRLKKFFSNWDILPANEIKSESRLTDRMIWEFAKTNQYTILTFDEDFAELQNLLSYPPKIVWLRTGNITTSEIANLLLKRADDINNFMAILNQASAKFTVKKPCKLQGFLIYLSRPGKS